jgi:predicted  nucleic acid-binding Zn-ribbon protein
MSPRCVNCGTEWDTDPRLGVACPTCGADAGEPCRRPSEHRCAPHVRRDRRAWDAGEIEQCECVLSEQRETEQAELGSY